MKARTSVILFLVVSTTLVIAAVAGCAYYAPAAATARENPSDTKSKKTLRPFRSDKELKDYFRELAEKQRREARQRAGEPQAQPASPALGATTAADAPAAKSEVGANKAAGKDDEDESVTNVQHAGVDEGGIVKVHGDHLVVLRRGRLFTVAVGDGALRPVSRSTPSAPTSTRDDAWYDEMLVAGDTVVVIGYSYERGGTEIGLFDIDDAGRLRYRSTYHLRSNDYYSSRNYASRLIGNKLIFYTPLYLSPRRGRPDAVVPGAAQLAQGREGRASSSRSSPRRASIGPSAPSTRDDGLALHTVTVCDLAQRRDCVRGDRGGGPAGPRLLRLARVGLRLDDRLVAASRRAHSAQPLDALPHAARRLRADRAAASRAAPSTSSRSWRARTGTSTCWCAPTRRATGCGARRWRPATWRCCACPLASFSRWRAEAVPASSYRALPKPEGYTFQNRFVGDYLLYGTGSGWGAPESSNSSSLYAVRWAGGDARS